MNKGLAISLITIPMLFGCVGYGKRYEVLFSSSEKIIIQYDSVIASYKTIYLVAEQHCAMSGGEPVVDAIAKDSISFGLIKTYTFKCE